MAAHVPDLFSRDLPEACVAYRRARVPDSEQAWRMREHCERLWRVFHPYADAQFLDEFPRHFHERWFEMFLAVRLLERGAQLQHTAPPGPDSLFTVDGRRVWVEAVCGTAGEPGRPDTVVRSSAGHVPWNLIALRIRAAIDEKKRKYDQYLERGIVVEGDSLLIALNVDQIPHAALDCQTYIFRALFGVGNRVITIDRKTMKGVSSSNEQLVSIAKLSSGAPVGTQPFIDGSMPAIAGAIVSADNAMGAAHAESPPALTLYPNLTARTPWTTGALPVTHEWRFESNSATDGAASCSRFERLCWRPGALSARLRSLDYRQIVCLPRALPGCAAHVLRDALPRSHWRHHGRRDWRDRRWQGAGITGEPRMASVRFIPTSAGATFPSDGH
jgi:hypothetical protein